MRKKLLIIGLLLILTVSFVGSDYAVAQEFSADNEQTLKKVGVGGLVILGVWGITKWISNHRQQNYQRYLKRGKMYLEEEDYKLAVKNFKQASNIKDDLEVEELLHQAKGKYQQKHYQLGTEYLAEEEWELAYQEFEKVNQYGTYLDTKQKYQQAYSKLKQLKLKRIATVKFDSNSYHYNLGSRATSLFTAQLLEKKPKFIEVIEREELNEILAEQKLGASGIIDSSTAQDIGNILGVDYLVVGEVISGDVSQTKDYQRVEVHYKDQKVKRYTVHKVAYTQVFFKLLDVTNGAVVLSQRVKKKETYKETYYEGDSVVVPSDQELIDEAMNKAVKVFAEKVYQEYEL
ncbi:CsgG/HfaB family protein [Halanaerobaculum tunisiense]